MIARWILPILLVQVAILLANLRHYRRRQVPVKSDAADDASRLSVLVPVRNERDRLPALLDSLRAQQPAPLEVILCDDSSDDGTREWLEANLSLHGSGERLSWFPAPPKPTDWVGKNWACHQLAQKARGDWLLFLDADLRLHEQSIASIAHSIQQFAQEDRGVQLITVIPTLESSSVPVALLKSMVPFSVFTLLPLHFAETHPHRSFAFANGQAIAFPQEFYRHAQPHERVRRAVLEDVELARVVKADGGQVRILDGRAVLRVSMYSGLREAVDGFSKNGVAICGSAFGAVLVAIALAAVYVLPLWEAVQSGGTVWHGLDVALSVALFALSGWMAGLPLWLGVLYPLSIVIGEWTLWRSIVWYTRGEVRWKGRAYPVP